MGHLLQHLLKTSGRAAVAALASGAKALTWRLWLSLLLLLQVSSVVSRIFQVSCQGLLDVAALQEMLAPAGLLEDDQAVRVTLL
jgi:hypothetical protein